MQILLLVTTLNFHLFKKRGQDFRRSRKLEYNKSPLKSLIQMLADICIQYCFNNIQMHRPFSFHSHKRLPSLLVLLVQNVGRLFFKKIS